MPSIHRLGARVPWPGTDGVPEIAQKEIAPRQTAAFECDQGHTFALVFAAEAVVPETWECRRCGRTARLEGAPAGADTEPAAPKLRPGKHKPLAGEDTTPWGQLMKRRSLEDGEVLLAEGRERRRQAEAAS
jgi:hypothetical protein